MAELGLGEKPFSEWLMVRVGTQADDFQLLCLLRWADSSHSCGTLAAIAPTLVLSILKIHYQCHQCRKPVLKAVASPLH